MVMRNLIPENFKYPAEIVDILRKSLDLSKKQLECYLNILELQGKGICILKLTHHMSSERSIIQKNLKILMDKKLIYRKSVTLTEFRKLCVDMNQNEFMPKSNKGYLYIYYPIEIQDLQKCIEEILENWKNQINIFFSK